MVTNESIAKAAGVSTATVSRVLNNVPGVAASTKEAVLSACRRLGRPTDAENAPKQVVVISVISGLELTEPLLQSAGEFNISLLFKNVYQNDLTVDKIAADSTMNGPFDGALLIDSVVGEEEMAQLRSQMPVVELRNYNRCEPEASVLVDDFAIGYEMTNHLIATGKQRIAYLRPNEFFRDRPHCIERLNGYYAALARSRLSPAKEYYLDDEGYMDKMLQDAGSVWDAIIYTEPLEEMPRFLQALRQAGHRIPEELAVCALGDSAVSRSNDITAMDQPLEAIARNGLFLLDNLMNHRLVLRESIQLRLKPKLIIRGSTVLNEESSAS